MKFCPYCGATLMGSAAAYCSECGKPRTSPAEESSAQTENMAQSMRPVASTPGRTANGRQPYTKRSGSPPRTGPGGKHSGASRTRNKKTPGKRPAPPPARPKSNQHKKRTPEYKAAPNPMDENYDGYYDDVPTDDNGHTKEQLEPELIKRIVLIAAGAVAIVILSVVMMYLL